MGQVSKKLRRTELGYAHWCPGCGEMHVIFDNWTFDGNLENPTFNPSVKITGKKTIMVDGKWTGEWVRDEAGNPVDSCCHYHLHAGELKFCSDSLHPLAGKTVPLPDLPDFLED
jgi:Family of unknown function (DUF6527)